jgi:sulfur relay (sulfurtransferase) DsrF/TusC family protein
MKDVFLELGRRFGLTREQAREQFQACISGRRKFSPEMEIAFRDAAYALAEAQQSGQIEPRPYRENREVRPAIRKEKSRPMRVD